MLNRTGKTKAENNHNNDNNKSLVWPTSVPAFSEPQFVEPVSVCESQLINVCKESDKRLRKGEMKEIMKERMSNKEKPMGKTRKSKQERK